MDEKRDFRKILEYLDDEHRHDLALHLYVTHLLRRVNPYFPHGNWSSWPLPPSRVPEVMDKYEDTLERHTRVLAENEVGSRPLEDQFYVSFKRHQLKITVQQKRKEQLPNPVLVNAIHDVVQRKIRMKLNTRGLSLDVNHKSNTCRALSLQIANRLSRVLWKLLKNRISRRKNILLKTWQDVQIANVMGRSKSERARLISYRVSYEQARAIFMEHTQSYEYDSSAYASDVESDSNGDPNFVLTTPDFKVEHHLSAIENEGTMPFKSKRDAITELERRRADFERKEQLFINIWDDAATSSQHSFAADNAASYKITSGVMKKEREAVLTSNILGKDDYQIQFTK